MSGPGYGNKSQPEPVSEGHETRFDIHKNSDPYIDAGRFGSGTTSGAGFGNKTGSFSSSKDSTVGKVMEKVGHVVHNKGMVEKGHTMREHAGYQANSG